ncbi:unnamed protein product [Arctogadus glacialis]
MQSRGCARLSHARHISHREEDEVGPGRSGGGSQAPSFASFRARIAASFLPAAVRLPSRRSLSSCAARSSPAFRPRRSPPRRSLALSARFAPVAPRPSPLLGAPLTVTRIPHHRAFDPKSSPRTPAGVHPSARCRLRVTPPCPQCVSLRAPRPSGASLGPVAPHAPFDVISHFFPRFANLSSHRTLYRFPPLTRLLRGSASPRASASPYRT